MLGVGVAGPIGDALTEPGSRPTVPSDEPFEERPDAGAERDAWAILASVDGLGPVGLGALLRRYGSGVAILREAATPGGPSRLAVVAAGGPDEAPPTSVQVGVAAAIATAAEESERTLERIRGIGLRIVTVDEPTYPLRLAAVEMPPHVLYVLGDPAALNTPRAVAIVGTRRATDTGRAVASRLAAELVAAGASVVSGLAVGIDGAAHASAVHAGGTTVAVIGSGHAVLHPRAHSRLAATIVASGGAVVSELGPDVDPTIGTFPRRNRIISGLAEATVVVEAPARSGALITASWALEQGRECFLVPGPIGAPASAGCLAFLREYPDAARIVAGIPQLIDDLGLADHFAEPGVSTAAAATLVGVGAAAARIGRELVTGRATVDELVAATGWPVASVLATLTLLERRGLAVGVHGRFRPAGGLASADPRDLRRHPTTRA